LITVALKSIEASSIRKMAIPRSSPKTNDLKRN
jgi:hypothetical protein